VPDAVHVERVEADLFGHLLLMGFSVRKHTTAS
jgi:hypothetical protein